MLSDEPDLLAETRRQRGEAGAAGPYSIGSGHWPGLAKVIEECGEVIQAAGKIIAANGDGRHWDGSDLRQRLEDEIADARAAIEFLAAMNGLDWERIIRRETIKAGLFRQWHLEHSDGTAKPEQETP